MSDPEQIDLAGEPIDADPAEDVFGGDPPKCANVDPDTGRCNRNAVIGVKLDVDGFEWRDGYVPACPRHSKAAWLIAAGIDGE